MKVERELGLERRQIHTALISRNGNLVLACIGEAFSIFQKKTLKTRHKIEESYGNTEGRPFLILVQF